MRIVRRSAHYELNKLLFTKKDFRSKQAPAVFCGQDWRIQSEIVKIRGKK